MSALGYAIPGTVAAVAVYVPLAWVDRQLPGPRCLTGTASAWSSPTSCASTRWRCCRSSRAWAGSTRRSTKRRAGLGASRARLLTDVHVPLLVPGVATAGLLVFVEVLKELPATALLRPLGGDTLSIAVWEATKESRFDVAALPALLIILAGLVPVVAAIRLSRG